MSWILPDDIWKKSIFAKSLRVHELTFFFTELHALITNSVDAGFCFQHFTQKSHRYKPLAYNFYHIYPYLI